MPQDDIYDVYGDNVPTASAGSAVMVTPNDAENLERVSRSIYVGGDGDLVVEMKSGELVTFEGVKGGFPYPFRCIKVFATGTTATGIVALF